MREHFFTIRGKLPSLNDVIGANRTNPYKGAKLKKDVEELIGWHIIEAKSNGRLDRIKEPCEIRIDFYESTARRDVDNIHSSTKFILDALVKQGILPNDNQKWVKQVYHTVKSADSDYVIVYLFEGGHFELKMDEECLL